MFFVGILAAFVQPEHDGGRDVGGRPPGAAFLPPGEIIDVRLEDFQDPSPPRINGHRTAQPQRPQPGRDLAGELPVVHDEQRGGDLFRLGGQFRMPEEQLGQQDRPLVIRQPPLPGTHGTIVTPTPHSTELCLTDLARIGRGSRRSPRGGGDLLACSRG